MLDRYRNTTPEEWAPAIAPEPEPLLGQRKAGSPDREMRVMQHALDRFTVVLNTPNHITTLIVDHATLYAWGELLFRAAEDAPRAEGGE